MRKPLLRFHPLDEGSEVGTHLGGGQTITSAMAGKDPFEVVFEQARERFPQARPRPAIGAIGEEIAVREIPGERIAGKKATIPKIAYAAARVPWHGNGKKIMGNRDGLVSHKGFAGKRSRGAVLFVNPNRRAEMISVAFSIADIVFVGKQNTREATPRRKLIDDRVLPP